MPDQRRFVTTAPENSETPLENVRSWVTPNRLFFVRTHFQVPNLELGSWCLRVDGCVDRPMEWSWDRLTALPERTVFATVECAGNGRSFLQPAVAGVPWGAGAIGHAEWTGIPLRMVLDEAGIRSNAVAVVVEGVDRGSEADHPEPMQFARGLPLAKAVHADTLLAVRMNGEPLEPEHGYPVRLFVPGWYGVNSVKWVRRITVLDHASAGYFETVKYSIQRRTPHGIETVAVGPMQVKSEIIRPRPNDVLGIGTNRIFGIAWAGEDAVAGVDISIDGGNSWNAAEIVGPRAPYSWVLWEYLWEVAAAGEYTLLARATSSAGAVQPMCHDALHGGYLIHHSRPLTVYVETSRHVHARAADADLLLYDMNAFAEENSRFPLDVEMEFAEGEGI